MRSISLPALAWLAFACDVLPAAAVDLKAALTFPGNSWNGRTSIAFAGSQQFQNATARWSVFDSPTYVAAVSPAVEADVALTVKIARSLKLPFLATGGRHGYGTTLGRLEKGIAIDLSQLNSVKVDAKAGTLTIGGGVRIGDILDTVYNAGFEIQTGSLTCPGMVGATLGGGVGRYQGLHGLVIDALTSVRLVTADGRIVEASAKTNPDLFWGLRGAGGNFGIVTSATYTLSKLVNGGQVTNVDFLIPAAQNASYFAALAQYEGKLPAELSSISIVNYDTTSNQTQILANWVYAGPEADARKALQSIFDIQPPVAVVSVVPWNKLLTTAGFGVDPAICQPGQIHDIYTVNVKKLNAQTYTTMFSKMAKFYQDHPEARGSVTQLEVFPNQAMAAVPKDQTAYPWRDSLGNMMFQFTWTGSNASTQNAVTALGKDLQADFFATSGYPDLAVYVSYAHGDETIEQIYGKDKLPRLAALKQKWDPDNQFGFNNAIPTKYP